MSTHHFHLVYIIKMATSSHWPGKSYLREQSWCGSISAHAPRPLQTVHISSLPEMVQYSAQARTVLGETNPST